MTSGLEQTIDRRNEAHRRLINGLAHLDRVQAMSIILSWFSVAELEDLLIPSMLKEHYRK